MIAVIIPWAILGLALLELASRGVVTRRITQLIAVGVIKLDLAAQGLVRTLAPPKYVLQGDCQRCGACCRSLVGDPPQVIKKSSVLLRTFIAYHRATHRFEAYARGPNGEVLFRCGHLQTDNTCGIYWRRPLVCRTYPVVPSFGIPKLLPDCSYRIAARPVTLMVKRASLPIVNPVVATHHPTPIHEGESQPEDYELVAMDPTK
jgi:hypothetical protein